jgi:hypothetical protein
MAIVARLSQTRVGAYSVGTTELQSRTTNTMLRIQDLAQRLNVDRAIGYAIVMRAWQLPAAVVTTVLIALNFDEQTQGVYYTLLTVIGLQSLADSGLLNVLMHAVSHEWSELHLDRQGFLRGPRRIRRRVAGMARFGLIWFVLVGVALVVTGIAIGIGLFSGQGVLDQAMRPLAIGMLLAGASLTLAPLIAVLEGCNQVEHVNRYRLMQAVTGSIVVWSCLAGGANLWTPVFAVLIQLVWECVLTFGRYRRLFTQLYRTGSGGFDWKAEIWPLQWKIGLQSGVKYLALFPLIPTLFAWQSPEVAGRMGMTWQVLTNLLLIGYAWIRTRAPEFGRLIAGGNGAAATQAFIKATIGSTLLLVTAVLSFWIVLVALRAGPFQLGAQVAGRFIDPGTTLLFAIAIIPLHLTQCFSMHLRSRKIDPIWRISIAGNLILGLCVFIAASQLGVAAVGIAMLVVFSVVMSLVIAVWVKYQRSPTADQ